MRTPDEETTVFEVTLPREARPHEIVVLAPT